MEWVVSVSLTCLSDRDKQRRPARQKERKSSLHSTGCPIRFVPQYAADYLEFTGLCLKSAEFRSKIFLGHSTLGCLGRVLKQFVCRRAVIKTAAATAALPSALLSRGSIWSGERKRRGGVAGGMEGASHYRHARARRNYKKISPPPIVMAGHF